MKKVINLLLIGVMILSSSLSSLAASHYTVEKGNKLWKIAKNHNATTEELAKGNKLDNPDLIYVGQELEISNGSVKWTSTKTESGYIKVENKGGETLGYSEESGIKLLFDNGFAFKDSNKNNKLDKYEDWRLDDDIRAKDLASQLSIEDIAGLMLYSAHQFAITEELSEEQMKFLKEDGVRAVLNAAPNASTETTAKWNNAAQAFVEGFGFGIPVNFSSDPRSEPLPGEAYSVGAGDISKWPSNLGLAATFDPAITERSGEITSAEYRALGLGTALSPQVDVATEPRWGRVYGTFGEDPALSRDMARAYATGFQSTYDENGNDLGWGKDSVNAMIKHWPGDGAGEGGREAHSGIGKYQVYPGGQFETHLIPFVDGGFKLDSKTSQVAAMMASYSIAWTEDESLGELVGSAYSEYKINNLLRGTYGFDGVVCTDWMITHDGWEPWGVENLNQAERHYKIIMSGVDQFGGNNDKKPVLAAYEIGVKENGEEFMRSRFEESAVRLLKNIFKPDLFENPYIDVPEAVKFVGNADFRAEGYEAQLKSVVMLKNENNIIGKADGSTEKPTVYIPMVYSTIVPGFSNLGMPDTQAKWSLPVNIDVANKYFNVITDKISDTLTGPVDEDGNGNPTVSINDIVRATPEELANCDYALPVIENPKNVGNYFIGYGYDRANEEYLPVSLQYRPYTADSKYVRKESISGDIVNGEKENRSYYGKTSQMMNESHLDAVLYAVDNVPEGTPVIVAIRGNSPMIFSEFESKVDAIIMGFGITDQAMFDIATGKYEPKGLLPLQMPKNMETVEKQYEDVPRDMECYVDEAGNTYDFAFGLNWSGEINDERTKKYDVPALVTPENKGK